MKYYIKEMQIKENAPMTAGVKARDDVSDILDKMGFHPIIVNSPLQNRQMIHHIKGHWEMKEAWDKSLDGCGKGDILVIQFPAVNHTVFLYRVIKKIKSRGAKICLLIHDLDMLRIAKLKNIKLKKRIGIIVEEKSLLNISDYIVVHNRKMKQAFIDMGYSEERLVDLEIFDYLIPNVKDNKVAKVDFEAPVVLAGTLRKHKAQYAYELPDAPKFGLYGVGYEGREKSNVIYYGAFQPDELPFNLKGSFGLVWDGEKADTCSGVFGEYLRINNPHKTSLYLASGLPVVIWRDAALADFITENKCGITIDSLGNLENILDKMSQEEYDIFKANASDISYKMRTGYYTKKAITNVLKMNENQDK